MNDSSKPSATPTNLNVVAGKQVERSQPVFHCKHQIIARSRMKKRPYSVRKDLTPAQRLALARSIKEFGLVSAPVWNKRTGNIVDGYNRISVLDEFHHGADYSLTVCLVDLDKDHEKAAHIISNIF